MGEVLPLCGGRPVCVRQFLLRGTAVPRRRRQNPLPVAPLPAGRRGGADIASSKDLVPVIQALAKILNFKPPTTTSIQEDSQFLVWATASSRTVVVPTPWESDLLIQAATKTDDRRVVKEASSFGDSTLAKFLPLSEEDEALLKVLELDNEAIVYMRSTQNPDWDPAKPFGPKVPHATKEAEKFAKVSETSAALTARLGIYLQRTQGFISGAFVAHVHGNVSTPL